MVKPLISVILAGGKGERFWPLSRLDRPKQFLSLDGSGESLLQTTAIRLLAAAQGWQNIWVVTSQRLADGVRTQLPELPSTNLLVEPEGRDTAPALAWSTLEIAKCYGDDAVVGFFPADHWIPDVDRFTQTLEAAAAAAVSESAIVTLGITPTAPSTGYGYIAQGKVVNSTQVGDHAYTTYRVDRFAEKPDLATAKMFLDQGGYSWNAGMFVFEIRTMLAELQAHAPEILEPLQSQGIAAYATLPKQSIDYALMEKTDRACVIPVSFTWDDLGDWGAVDRLLKTDAPNVEIAQHVGLDTQGALLYSTNPNDLIVTIGLEDLVIVRDGNVTLIARKDRTQDIKQVLKTIQANPDYQQHL